YAVQAADMFATGGVDLLTRLGAQTLVFGVEDANLNFEYFGDRISKIPRQREEFADYSQTYSTQYNQMVAREVGHEVSEPNAILGLAYAVANANLGSPLKLRPVNRVGAGHDDILQREAAVQSASAIRNLLLNGASYAELEQWLPKGEIAAFEQEKALPNWELLFPLLKYRLESASIAELQRIYQMSEGLEYKFKAEIHLAQNFAEFLRHVKSKRYTYSRLRRLSLYTLLNVTESDLLGSYDHVSTMLLGYSKRGRKYLKKQRKNFAVDIVSKVDRKNAQEGTLGLQVRTDRLFEQIVGVDQNFGRRPLEVN
ncbi:nucleotidyltransferase family protein, partial [Lactobacillus nasalidis]